MGWQDAISPLDPGESGQVYYLNVMMTFDKVHHCWTKGAPFTLNPKQGKTIEQLLKNSKSMTNDIKDGLLKKRKAEVRLDNGNVLKWWISTEKAPQTWGSKPDSRIILM